MAKPLVILLCACGLSAGTVASITSVLESSGASKIIVVDSNHTNEFASKMNEIAILRDKMLMGTLLPRQLNIHLVTYTAPEQRSLRGLGIVENIKLALKANCRLVGLGEDLWDLVATRDRI